MNFSGVPDTLFIPLTARIYISKRFPDYFYDERALSLESALPNNLIEKKSNQYQMFASVSRYFNMDKMIREYIDKHNDCNIINIGCGFETAYFRINDRRATFYELDLSEVIENRRKVLGENEGEILLPYSMFDYEWCDKIDKSKPSFLIASGVFEYFKEEKILEFLNEVKKRIGEYDVVFDCSNSKGIGYTNRYVKKTGNSDAMMYFYVDDETEFARKANATLVEYMTFFTETRKVVKKGLNLYSKVAMKMVDNGKMGNIIHLRV